MEQHAPLTPASVSQHEMCETVDDFLERRTRLAFLNARAALAAVPRVAALMAKEQRWSEERRTREEARATEAIRASFFCKASP